MIFWFIILRIVEIDSSWNFGGSKVNNFQHLYFKLTENNKNKEHLYLKLVFNRIVLLIILQYNIISHTLNTVTKQIIKLYFNIIMCALSTIINII